MQQSKLGKYTVLFPNGREYHFLKREIFSQDIYYFESKKDSPFIIDIGSHIGISVLYFKSLYPNSRILAFEPNPKSYEILLENIQMNNLVDIHPTEMAVSSKKGLIPFYIDSENSGWDSNSSLLKGSWSGKEKSKEIQVQSTTLKEYLKDVECIDMLKIDTEGSELDILKSHKDILNIVENISIEYHPVRGRKIKGIIEILKPYFDITLIYEGKELKNVKDGKLLTIKGKKRK